MMRPSHRAIRSAVTLLRLSPGILILFAQSQPRARAQFVQQGSKLADASKSQLGASVALSADGNTALVGAPNATVFIRANNVWSLQGSIPVGIGAVGNSTQANVALSADGNTAIVGGFGDNGGVGAAWVFTRSNGAWTQQGLKLVGKPAVGESVQGSVALSADGNTVIIGGLGDNSGAGAIWVFTRINQAWSQYGGKLVGSGAINGAGGANQGTSVAISGDGNTAIAGGPGDNSCIGAIWVFTRTDGVWSQQGKKLVATDAGFTDCRSKELGLGYSVALSADGNTAITGSEGENGGAGAVWVFTRSNGVWTQQGPELVGSNASTDASQGAAVAVSADGNTLIEGGPFDNITTGGEGAVWVFRRSYTAQGATWTQQGNKLFGSGAVSTAFSEPLQGYSVAISANAGTFIEGGPFDNGGNGAVWVFTQPVATHLAVSAPPSVTAGVPFNFNVTALDAANNTFAGYSGAVQVTSTDGAANLPANTTLSSGTGTFSATLNTPGSQTLTAADTAVSSIAGTSGAIAVSSVATHFTVSAPASATAGTAFNLTVTAQDANNNTITGYSGTVHFTSTDGAAVLPANTTLTNGTGTFVGTLKTAGSQTITAADTASAGVTGTSSPIAVTVLVVVPPTPVSVSPAAGSGMAQTFSFTFSDGAPSGPGWQDLTVVDVLIASALDGRHACYAAFVPGSGSLYLVDDQGDSGGPYSGMVLPGSGSVSNSQCSIAGTGSSAAGSGNTLTLTLAITFTAAFAGNHVMYLAAQDASGNSGWSALGTWNAPGPAAAGPSVSGMSPGRTNNATQAYTFTFTDTNGWQDIAVANVLINSAINGIGACFVAFIPGSGSLFLVDNAGDAGGPYAGMQLPGSGAVSNGQCSIAGAGSSVAMSGNTLTLTVEITFSGSFAGNRVFYLAARSSTLNSGWQAVGTAAVP